MHCPLMILFLLPSAIALQSIYLATVSFSGNIGYYLAFFSDSNPCQDGTDFGHVYFGFENCDERLTILGHPNITFTGCKPYTGPPGTLPTGVSDNGVHALKCVKATNPPGGPYGAFANCQPNVSKFTGSVNLLEYCS